MLPRSQARETLWLGVELERKKALGQGQEKVLGPRSYTKTKEKQKIPAQDQLHRTR